MRKLVVILLFSASSLVFGQQVNFRQIDTASYNQYMRGDWKQLIETGKLAHDNDINYYYLQMRIAYAYFALEKYRQASVYYKNALKFNSRDAVANEFLYYSYMYSGRDMDALLMSKNLSALQKSAMNIRDSLKFVSFGISYTNISSNADQIQDAIYSGTTIKDGVQKATRTMHSPKLNLTHRIGTHILLEHNFTLINKNELSYTIVDYTEYISPDQPLNQLEYNLNADISIIEGLTIRPGIHFLNSTIPLYATTSYGMNAGRDRTALAEIQLKNWVTVLRVEKRLPYFDIGLSYVHHNFNLIGTNQIGIHSTVYPLSNLNFYVTLDAYKQFLKYNDLSTSAYIFKPLIGVKLHKNFWLELAGSLPEQFNFYDVRNAVAFNNIEKTSHTFEVYGIVPLYKSGTKLFIGYQYQGINSYYFPTESMLEPLNKQSYNTHLITGGIKWTM